LQLRALEAMAAAAGCDQLHLSASLNAVPFYQSAGFVRIRDEAYPPSSGIRLDSVFMEKHLR
jgi:putative acetyltransferase